MTTHARYAYVLTLALVPVLGCGDDGSSSADDSAGSTTSVGSTSDPSEGSTSIPPQTSDTSSSSGTPGTSSGADESGSGDSGSSSGAADPFANCTPDVLGDDFAVVDMFGMPGAVRWHGPGADPESGELLDDGTSEYVVSVTYLALDPDADLDLFGQLNVANSMALYGNPGMVAVQLGFSQECAAARTFTVWESQEAMMQFVSSEAHLQSVGAFPSLSRGGSVLSVWPGTSAASEIDWDTALANLAEAEAYD